jgi:hypothetical protein
MTKLELDRDGEGRVVDRPAFLRRQFLPPTTHAQTVFDVLFGIVAPILCFLFDPIVFRSADFGPALFSDYQAFAYLVSGVEILLLMVWLVWGRNLQPATRLAGGMLMSGAVISGLIGLILLPFSLLGLFLGVGAFGFIPFLTALVYLRNARSAFRLAAKPSRPHGSLRKPVEGRGLSGNRDWVGTTIIGCILMLGPPAALSFAASMFVSQAMNAVLSADERQADLAIDEIKYLEYFARPEIDKLVFAYEEANEPSRKEELKRRYLKLTGNDIEGRWRIIAD